MMEVSVCNHPGVQSGVCKLVVSPNEVGLRPFQCIGTLADIRKGEKISSKRIAAAHARSKLGCRAKFPNHLQRNGKIYVF